MQISPEALSDLRHMMPSSKIGAAVRLASAGAVEVMHYSEVGGVPVVECLVDDFGEPETVMLAHRGDGVIDSRCSCGEESPCRHIGAAYLVASDLLYGDDIDDAGLFSALGGRGRASGDPRAEWQRALDEVLPPSCENAAPGVELCLFMTVREVVDHSHAYGYRGGSVTAKRQVLSMRPGMRGARSKWIKGQAKWQGLDRLDANIDQLEAMLALDRFIDRGDAYGYWHQPDEWADLTQVASLDLWLSLERLQRVGVPIVSFGAAQLPVVLSREQAEVVGTAYRDSDMLVLGVELRLGDEQVRGGVLPFGTPTGGIAKVEHPGERAEAITLYELRSPLTGAAAQLLRRVEPLIVPNDEVETFEAQYLPRLLGELPLVSPDASYDVPEAPRSALRLEIEHGAQQTHLGWRWHRPSGVPDHERETALLTALREAGGDLAGLLWGSGTGAGAGAMVGASRAETAASGTGGPGNGSPVPLPVDATLGRAATARFNAELLPRIREVDGIEIIEAGAPGEYRAAEANPMVSVRSESSGDWFDLHFSVTIEGEEVEFAELFTALALGEPVFVLPSGTYFSLDGPEFARMREIVEEARALIDQPSSGEGVRVSRHQVDLWEELSELGVVAAQEAQWWSAVQSLGEGEGIIPVDPPPELRAELREYQAAGVAWLHFLRSHGLGGILADDMGLGKTLQTIAMMELAREEDPDRRPFLVVAPTSVVGNWAHECARFAPGLRVVTIDAMESRRGAPLADAVAGSNVVVTSYALFRGEADAYRELEWSGLILDEAQQIKNHASRGYRAARTLGAPFTLVITGTPLENNLLELWALAALAAPGLLGNRQRFTDYFRNPIERDKNAERLALLQRRLRPFLLRRTKDLVAADLPPKQEQVIEIELHPKHRKLYDVRFQRERQKLLGLIDDPRGNSFQIFQSLTLLRQLALDPALVDAGSAPSAKLEMLTELLTEAAEEGHRVLVLSQFTRFLSAARDRATEAGLASQYLDGATTRRQAVIDEFRGGSDPVFFVSLKAGGFGLNLVEADYVVLLDPWWNPAVEAQAIDRTHRIGQVRPVLVYRLVAANTIEQKVIALREAKAELFERVLSGGSAGADGGAPGSADAAGALTAAELRELLEP